MFCRDVATNSPSMPTSLSIPSMSVNRLMAGYFSPATRSFSSQKSEIQNVVKTRNSRLLLHLSHEIRVQLDALDRRVGGDGTSCAHYESATVAAPCVELPADFGLQGLL